MNKVDKTRGFRWLIAALLVILLLSGCSRLEIEGTWRSGSIDSASYWQFRPDGKMSISSGLITIRGTYTLKGRKLRTVQDRPIEYDVSFREDELTLRADDETTVLYRVEE